MLSKEELKRYNRHIILPEFGMEAQEKLKRAKVLVIGAGGLGCPILQYLTAAGVGTLGIIDFDHVEESNLQRQVLFGLEDVGKLKAEVAAAKLARQNPFVKFEVHSFKLDRGNALDLLSKYDIVVDGSDNFPTRYLVSDACTILKKPLIFGSIFKFEGQVSVFNYTSPSGEKSPTYRCLFPDPPSADAVPNCSTIGVLGVLPGMIGTIQANEAIKVITGIGKPLAGRLMVLDALTMGSQIIQITADQENLDITSLQDNYEEICQAPVTEPLDNASDFAEMSVTMLNEKLLKGEDIFLLDVRESFEYQICHLPASVLIPMAHITDQLDKIPRDKQVVIYCHHGMRSASVLKFLAREHRYKNLINLRSGIDDWALQVDQNMERY